MVRLLTFFIVIFLFGRCTSNNTCSENLTRVIDSLLTSQSGYSDFYRNSQIANKRKVTNGICGKFSDSVRILIIDVAGRGGQDFYGLVYVYNHDKYFSYKEDESKFEIISGHQFDRNGTLTKICSLIKDSSIQKLTAVQAIKSNLVDDFGYNIFHLNSKDKIYHKFRIHGDQLISYFGKQ